MSGCLRRAALAVYQTYFPKDAGRPRWKPKTPEEWARVHRMNMATVARVSTLAAALFLMLYFDLL